jgi:prepilin-type N-terminal cleavage/methylation domain-containing protein
MNRKGFTLIELVMIIVLIGILAVFMAPRTPDVGGTKAGVFAHKLRADIRYAQNLAMTQNMRYRVFLNMGPGPASGYAVMNDSNGNGTWGEAGEIAPDPAGGGDLVVNLNTGEFTGITVGTPANGGTGFVEFNSLGSPTAGGVTTIRVYANGTAVGNDITIEAGTGAVN